MRIIALQCSQCSAPLDVPADREQITCEWCGAILHVSRLKPAAPPPAGAGVSPRQAELDQLDAQWDAYRTRYLPQDGAGGFVVPEPEACRMGAWASGVIGAVVAIIAAASGNWGYVVVPVMIAAVVVGILLRQAKIAPVYQRSLANYRKSRREILQRMQPDS